MNRRTRLLYAALLLAWVTVVAWQAVEHGGVRRASRDALINRAKDISNTLGLVMRSQRRFGGVISKERMESALQSLVRPGEVEAIALLNHAGDIVASAGPSADLNLPRLAPSGEYWANDRVALVNLVDLGTNLTAEMEGARPTIVVPRSEMFPSFGTNRPPPPPEGSPAADQPAAPNPNPEPAPSGPPPGPPPTNGPPRWGAWPRPGEGRPPFGRPFWMSEQEYQSLLQKQGVHSFVVVLSADALRARSDQDLWLRSVIVVLAAVSCVGLGLAWRTLVRSSELEVRLARAAELNTRLKEMNLAAAGLAHETKNPLNIIRGLAQIISRHEEASTEVRQKSREIVDETDRVTAQLNEFINYSRPREVRRTTVPLGSVLQEVVRALGYDLEEKAIQLQSVDGAPQIEADERLLRQALFNLLLNAIQAVPRGGQIQIALHKTSAHEAALDIRDNGPGVAPEHRADIFKPYFTTHEQGTGLGLAVVQQIVLAHGWEVEYLPNEPRGAIFRLSHLRLAATP